MTTKHIIDMSVRTIELGSDVIMHDSVETSLYGVAADESPAPVRGIKCRQCEYDDHARSDACTMPKRWIVLC